MASQQLNLEDEEVRFHTFQTWPHPYVDPRELATYGFYYTNFEDFVKCFACGLEIGDWVMGDDPFMLHENLRPDCPFIQSFFTSNFTVTGNNFTVTGNFDSYQLSIHITSNNPPSQSSSRRNSTNSVNSIGNSLELLGITETGPPLHTRYASPESRLQSFRKWPVSIKTRPEKLFEAGFFYTGRSDKTVCFHCGIELFGWMDTDDPWVEHAKCSPECSYVLLNKGRDFVKNVLGDMEQEISLKDIKNMEIPEELKGLLQIRENPRPSTSGSGNGSTEMETSHNQEPTYLDQPEPGCSKGKSGKSAGSKGRGGKGKKATSSLDKKENLADSKNPDEQIDNAAVPKNSAGKEGEVAASRNDGVKDADDRLCKICRQEPLGVAFLPCGHLIACEKCAPSLEKCAVCGQRFTATVRLYLA